MQLFLVEFEAGDSRDYTEGAALVRADTAERATALLAAYDPSLTVGTAKAVDVSGTDERALGTLDW